MAVAVHSLGTNRLLESLPRLERKRLLDQCEITELTFGAILCEPGQLFSHAYFPISGFVSLVTTLGKHQPLEMGLIGNEGMLGATLALGVEAAPLRGVVQGPGTALRIDAAALRRALGDSPGLRRTLHHYIYILICQLSQSAACIHFHAVAPRLARWLLMTHDRAHADHFHLTHQFLADMLGVQRSAVSIAAGVLQKNELLIYTRGEIQILNRKGLEAVSCECYGEVLADYDHLLN